MAGNKFASGKNAIALCDRCGQQYKLSRLRKLTVKGRIVSTKVCPECFDPDHPQLMLGAYPVYDPQALREPRPDSSFLQSGAGVNGEPGLGSRVVQWGWNPVGGAWFNFGITPNDLVATTRLGAVTVEIG